jgi:hypothetical protein
VCTSVGIIRVQGCHSESVSEDNDQSPIRFRRAFSIAGRAKLNLAVAKSTNFIDLASVEDEPKRERERERER